MMDSRLSARALVEHLGAWRTREPAYEALADAIRLLCLDNRIAPRTALPAERELAARLRMSRTTVAAAYRSLRESAHIESVRGSGSVTLPLGQRDLGRASDVEGAIDLQQASPPAWPGLASVYAEVAATASTIVARSGYETLGRLGLREAIAQRYSERGLPTTAAQVMVTTGAQSAIALTARLLLSRGDRVLIETPTYPHAAESFAAAGARLVGVPVTPGSGWDLDRADDAFRRAAPVAAYLMPAFHNPTGETMPHDVAVQMATAARASGTVVIVDETTAELDVDGGTPAEPFAAAAPAGAEVITLGSVSKTVWGGLRVGWIRADEEVIRRLLALRPVFDLGTPEFEQAVVERLVPLMPEIVAQRGEMLRAGRDALVAALDRRLPQWSVHTASGGVALWVGLGVARSSALVMAARRRGVLLSAGPRFSVGGGHERHLRIPFTASADRLEHAVEVLAASWEDVVDGPGSVLEERGADALV
ncbi:PLP-dependent aminotransferase family protein [Microbacterium betulae]|uniref:PLP-dependent aminotransferase family protein n=1 Tax=Microbacterium betulae TaxID=2981139 RepID=A0AA97I7R7_9MICO|nr:PLP-dependent aminotransferase family protein [Microbacterium sp. AB]WOF24552.1 PLP-dependent aminotransferase family protein [Microbacterium sp. AB]